MNSIINEQEIDGIVKEILTDFDKGRNIDEIGFYDPTKDPSVIKVDQEKAATWLGNGAQPTETVKKLLKIAGIE